jgi:hypothetical protein
MLEGAAGRLREGCLTEWWENMQCGVLNCGGNTQEGAEEVAVSFLFSSVTLTVYCEISIPIIS